MLKIPLKPPSFRFLFSHPAHFIACGFGSGLTTKMPGTFGTLFAWASYFLIRPLMDPSNFLIFLLASFILGIWAAHKTGADLGVIDHSSIVWDEIVPFWFVLFFCPATLFWQCIAFVLFRILDISKPQPARYFDTQVKNGFGVMTDDLCAAIYTILIILGLQHISPYAAPYLPQFAQNLL